MGWLKRVLVAYPPPAQVGPSAMEALRRLGINTVMDLLLHLPVGIFDW